MNTNKMSIRSKIAMIIVTITMVLSACNVKQSCQTTACGLMSQTSVEQTISDVLAGDNAQNTLSGGN